MSWPPRSFRGSLLEDRKTTDDECFQSNLQRNHQDERGKSKTAMINDHKNKNRSKQPIENAENSRSPTTAWRQLLTTKSHEKFKRNRYKLKYIPCTNILQLLGMSPLLLFQDTWRTTSEDEAYPNHDLGIHQTFPKTAKCEDFFLCAARHLREPHVQRNPNKNKARQKVLLFHPESRSKSFRR